MNEVLREEKKYLITTQDMYKISGNLMNVMHLDDHGGAEGYTIRSLYFDSLYDRDFDEKEQGIELRRKIRLRNYSPDDDFAKLEMKQKQGMYQKKRSLTISKEDALQLIQGNLSILLKQRNAFADECYAIMSEYLYRPKAVVTYYRKAFVAKENNIRVTFDHHLKGSETNFNIFDPCINENYLMDPYFAVLEVKFNGFLLSYIKDALQCADRSETSVSKYMLGRQTF